MGSIFSSGAKGTRRGLVGSLVSAPPASCVLVVLCILLGCTGKNPGIFAASTTQGDCAVNEDGSQTCKHSEYNPLDHCTVFMAPSTLGEDTNMGIYTGKDVKAKTDLNFPEIVVPILFREWGDHVDFTHDGVLWDRYIWEGEIMDIESYTDTNREDNRAVLVPGVGCTVNSILDLANIDSTHGSVFDDSGLRREKDPGAGASTPYHEANTTTLMDIPAGSELFAAYGDYWIPDIPGAQITLKTPLKEAERFLKVFESFAMNEESSVGQQSESWKQALYDLVRDNTYANSHALSNLPRVPWTKVSSYLQLSKEGKAERASPMPEEEGVAPSEANIGDISVPVDKDAPVVSHFVRKQSIRSDEWLHTNGYCQDHIRPGRSTIQQAGKGAFAARDLPKGTVIGYSPLIHFGVHGREAFTIEYNEDAEDADTLVTEDKPYKLYDLILNYSFGHSNSTVLLTPYGGMVNYINHNFNPEKRNVKVQWPSKDLVAHKTKWLSESPVFLRDVVEKIGLSFEYVATQDISEGEEVFMDYGAAWEAAWNEHIRNWKPLDTTIEDTYVHSSEWGEDYFRTAEEQETNPYPSNLVIMCHESYTQNADGSYEFVPVLSAGPEVVYCSVLDRFDAADGNSFYTISLDDISGSDEPVVVQNVDPSSIFLYDRAFSADWHQPNVFRHEIMIPDDVFPPTWMNGPPKDPF